MAEPAGAEIRYTAFLSYSHRDATPAGRLHRRLESYRVPKRLVGRDSARGPVPRRLWPIFRDREELPAATDLSETVRTALAQSGALIILCSPSAAGSLWVAEEIETFRRLHPDRPILAAILDGDPPACFPKVLRALGHDGTWHEPLATDLRPGKDGSHLGLLKLVAGITGLGLDDLVQRDANRRVRRVTAVTVAAVIAMLAMGALAAVAVQARREAERQRAEAEGQIEFMLTDLRTRLRSVGRLDVMTAVNVHALQYYGRQDLGGLPADSLERRARVLHAIGEDDVARSNLGVALATFLEAHRTTAEQLARSPNDPERIFNHGQSEYWVGRIHELRRNWPEARRQYALYAEAAERLISIAPENPDYMLEMAWGASNRGVIQRDADHDYAAAEASFRIAIGWFQRAYRTRPRKDDLRDLANAYADFADTFFARRLWAQSLAARLQQYRLTGRLYHSEPTNMEIAFRFATAENAVGRVLERMGDHLRAREYLLAAYRLSQGVAEHDPANTEWLSFQATVRCAILLEPNPPPELSGTRLRQEFLEQRRRLEAQNDPRASQLRYCPNR